MHRHIISILLASLFVAGCGKAPAESVTAAVVTLPAVPGNPGAAYFTLRGGPIENRLMNVSSPQVIRIELHDNVMQDGMMKMVPLAGGIDVPAGGDIAFSPGGKHAMLFDINPAIRPGDDVALEFSYANGRRISATAKALAPGDAGGHGH